LNAHDPAGYALSLSAVLAKYPLGVVEQCCDPANGLALGREFPPTPKSIADWCERRIKQHRGMIIWAGQRRVQAEQTFPDEHRQTMIERLSSLMHGLFDNKARA
jgi:hypothetical protein